MRSTFDTCIDSFALSLHVAIQWPGNLHVRNYSIPGMPTILYHFQPFREVDLGQKVVRL